MKLERGAVLEVRTELDVIEGRPEWRVHRFEAERSWWRVMACGLEARVEECRWPRLKRAEKCRRCFQ